MKKFSILLLIICIMTIISGCKKEPEVFINEYDITAMEKSSQMATTLSNAQVSNIDFDVMGNIFEKYKKLIDKTVYINWFDTKNENIKYLYSYGMDSRFYPQSYKRIYSNIGINEKRGQYNILHYYKVNYKLSSDAKGDDLDVLEDSGIYQTVYVYMLYTFNEEGKLISFLNWQI